MTDVLIDHFHGHQAALDFLTRQFDVGETPAVSVVSVTEFTGGMRSGEEAKTEDLLSLFVIVDINESIARQAGFYLRQFRRSHHIDLGDALIAATAKWLEIAVVTRNEKRYPMDDVVISVPYQRGL